MVMSPHPFCGHGGGRPLAGDVVDALKPAVENGMRSNERGC